MDASILTVLALLALMAGLVLVAGLVLGMARLLDRRHPPAPEMEARISETEACWEALLDGRGWLARPRRASRHARTRLWTLALLLISVPLVHLSWQRVRPRTTPEEPGEVILLVGAEKWADAVSMFEDQVRIRFEYLNAGERVVDAFNVQILVLDDSNRVVIQDHLSVNNPVAPHETSSWTQAYWASCEQRFTPAVWHALLTHDLDAYTIKWRPVALVFRDGEARGSRPLVDSEETRP